VCGTVRSDALTPALSHGEREKTRPPRLLERGRKRNIALNEFPLPWGEGENPSSSSFREREKT